MPIEVTKRFKYAHNGHTVVTVEVGDMVEGRAAEIAIELECADAPKVPKGKKLSPLETK